MKRPPRNPLKYLSPSQLLICVILFFAPWVEIQCGVPKAFLSNTPPANNDSALKEMVFVEVARQSGLDIALGKVSYADEKQRASGEMSAKSEKSKDSYAAPLLWLYLVALLAGIGLGFAMPTGTKRKRVLAGVCALALAVIGGQSAMGLPVMTKMAKEWEALGGQKDRNPLDERAQLKYKFPFYLSLFLVVGAMGIALLEPSVVAPPPPKDDEDDDDVPRRKRR